jgi:hypothetical protein
MNGRRGCTRHERQSYAPQAPHRHPHPRRCKCDSSAAITDGMQTEHRHSSVVEADMPMLEVANLVECKLACSLQRQHTACLRSFSAAGCHTPLCNALYSNRKMDGAHRPLTLRLLLAAAPRCLPPPAPPPPVEPLEPGFGAAWPQTARTTATPGSSMYIQQHPWPGSTVVVHQTAAIMQAKFDGSVRSRL